MRLTNVVQASVAIICYAAFTIPASAITLPAFDLPQIGSIEMPGTAQAGETVHVTVKAAKDGTSACGLVLDFGDGSNQQFKINADGVKLPVSAEHVYKKAGKYTVQAKGRKITTHHSCKESASAGILITTVKKLKGSTGKK
jgi:PKD domain-containing protein